MGRPTKTAFALGASSLVIFLVGSNIQSGWLYVLGASIAGVVISGLFIPVAVVRKIEVNRHVPQVGRVGDSIDVALELVNPTGSTKTGITGQDKFLFQTPFVVERIAPHSSTTVPYQLRLLRRGVYKEGVVRIASAFPFGVGRVKREANVSSDLIVHPPWTALSGFPLLEAASSPNEPIHDRRRKGSGLEFFGIREHRAGDSLRHVHWKSTARTGRLLVREYEEQPSSRLGVWIDSGPTVGDEPHTAFEDAVSCAASLVLYGLDVGHPAQLFCDTRKGLQHLFEPGRSDTLDWLAGLEAEGRTGLSRLAEDMIGEVHQRSTHVLLFPTTARSVEDVPGAISVLQGSSARVIAVAFSAASYAGRKTSEVLDGKKEEEFLARIGSNRVILYRVTKDKDIGECLRNPVLF